MKRLALSLAVLIAVASAALAASTPLDVLRDEQKRTASPALFAGLDGAPDLAARAALALGRTKRPAAENALRARLVTADAAVRAMAAYAEGLEADPQAEPRLRTLLRDDPSSGVRYAAADALGRIALAHPALAGRPLANALLAAARHDADPLVRGHAAANLDPFSAAPFAGDVARALPKAFAAEHDPGVRWHLMWVAFRGYATRMDPGFLRSALHDDEELVRVEALRAWARRTSDPSAVAAVTPLLGDRSWRVALEAREALKRLRHEAPTEHLTAQPQGVRFPPLPATPAPAPAEPRAAAAASPSAPKPEDVPSLPPLDPRSAAALDGPAPGAHPRVRIRTTKGDVVLALYPEWAPLTVANFLNLVARGYYDHNRFFRIVPDFVVQTGDPNDNGEGDAGYAIGAEENPVEQRTGIVAMGLNYDKNGAERDSAGTQFYVTLSPQLHLDRDFTVFGEVASGFDVLANLVESDRMVRVERIDDGPAPALDPER